MVGPVDLLANVDIFGQAERLFIVIVVDVADAPPLVGELQRVGNVNVICPWFGLR